MPRIQLTKQILLEKRAELIYVLHKEGWTDSDIGVIFNMERTWVYRTRKKIEKQIQKKA